MGDGRHRIEALAMLISDGEAVDWEAAERGVSDERRRGLIRCLRVVAEIAQGPTGTQVDAAVDPASSAAESLLGLASALDRAVDAHRDEPAADAVAPPSHWAHLEVRESLGQGTFGSVFRAWDTTLNREVALKLLRFDIRVDPHAGELEARVLREGRNLARVRHPNVVTVFGAGAHEGHVGLWMELIEGRTLEDLLREQGRFGPREAILIGIDVCRAVSAVHRVGLIHRDIKARNVMREEGGRIVLMDFGAGKELEAAASAVVSTIAGTPLYMAPEVLSGGTPTQRSDVYALGVLLHRLVTRTYPFEGQNVSELRRAHSNRTQRLLREVRSDLPVAFVRVVEKALALEPQTRFASVGQMEKALDTCLGARSNRRLLRPVALGLIVAGVAVAAVFGWRAVRSNRQRLAAVQLAPATLQWVTDGAPVCTAPGDQKNAAIDSDAAEGALIVWQDSRAGNKDIYAQRFDPFGTPLWGANGVAVCDDPGDQLRTDPMVVEAIPDPAVIWDARGGAFVTWIDNRSGGSEIYAQHLNASGSVADGWPANGIPICSSHGHKQNPALISDGQWGAIVIWEERRNMVYNIFAQHFDTSGLVLWGVDGIALAAQTRHEQQAPRVVGDYAGGVIVAWVERRNDNDIFAQHVSAAGKLLWSRRGVPVCTARGEQERHTLVSDGAAGAIFVWEDRRSGERDIFAQRLTGEGAIAPGWRRDGVGLCVFPMHDQALPVVAHDGAGGAIVAWNDWRNICQPKRTCSDIYAQRVGADGKIAWGPWGRPICSLPSDASWATICPDGEGGAVVAWWDTRNATPPVTTTPGAGDIYAQRFDGSGTVLWPVTGVPICTVDGLQSFPSLVSDRHGGAIIVWDDARAGNGDIYASRISGAGICPGAPPLLNVPENLTVQVDPGRQSARVEFTVTARGIPAPVLTCTPTTGSSFPIGITRVECSANNGSGTRKASFTVNVTGGVR